ncbi:MAG TPA: thioesterase family protein [Rhodanobacteraceae bacterium]
MTDEKKTGTTRRAPGRRSRSKPKAAPTVAAAGVATESAKPSPAAPAAAPPVTPSATTLATVPIHVRWHDLDAFNHVNNASFLILLEEARLQWLRNVPGEWFNEHAMPVMAAINLQYLRPITWPAEIDVLLTCERLGTTSMTIGNRVVERSNHACIYADGTIVMVWIDPATGQSVALPDAIRRACAPRNA